MDNRVYEAIKYSVEMMSKDFGRDRLGVHRCRLVYGKEIIFVSHGISKSIYTGVTAYIDLDENVQKKFDVPMIRMDIPVLKPEHRPLDFKAMTEAVIAWLKDNTRVVTCNEHENILNEL